MIYIKIGAFLLAIYIGLNDYELKVHSLFQND